MFVTKARISQDMHVSYQLPPQPSAFSAMHLSACVDVSVCQSHMGVSEFTDIQVMGCMYVNQRECVSVCVCVCAVSVAARVVLSVGQGWACLEPAAGRNRMSQCVSVEPSSSDFRKQMQFSWAAGLNGAAAPRLAPSEHPLCRENTPASGRVKKVI